AGSVRVTSKAPIRASVPGRRLRPRARGEPGGLRCQDRLGHGHHLTTRSPWTGRERPNRGSIRGAMDAAAEDLRALPKVELHRHLEGAIRLDTVLDLSRQA